MRRFFLRTGPALLMAGVLLFAACGKPKGTLPGQTQTFPPEEEVPELQGVAAAGGAEGAAAGLGEEAVQVGQATPPGLHIAHFGISPVTPRLRDAIHFAGYQSGGSSALLEFPIYGLNERQNIYFLIVPVINEGKAPVRNLKARADFFDGQGRLVWTETEALTHYPTRLALNPPSLPNKADPQPELGEKLSNYPLYYFPTNVGIFSFAVPDPTVAQTVRSWSITYLVSTT